MSKVKTVLLSLTFLLTSGAAFAQQQPAATGEHIHNAPVQIRGSEHPEKIPDALAYRLFMLSASIQPAKASDHRERERQKGHMDKINLSVLDRFQADTILANFRAQYENLVADFNREATQQQVVGVAADPTLFLQKRDALLDETRAALRRSMTPEGMKTFHTHVMSEKQSMSVFVDPDSQQ